MERREVSFISGNEQIAAWEYRGSEPTGTEESDAIVVMAHGLGGTRDAGLERFARRFADAGMRAMTFDYRHFGASTGEPRQLLDIGRQQDDLRAAVAHARSLDGVDPDRVAVWGFSFGGGHVVTIAAEDPRLGAAVAMCPMADGLSALRAFSTGRLSRALVAALRDEWTRLRRGPPHYIPLVGPPGATAALTTDDAVDGYIGNLVPEVTAWENRYAARLNLRFPFYRAVRSSHRIACPILVTICDRDTVTFPEPAARVAAQAPRGEARRYDSDHYEIWAGELLERAAADQTAFLLRSLRA